MEFLFQLLIAMESFIKRLFLEEKEFRHESDAIKIDSLNLFFTSKSIFIFILQKKKTLCKQSHAIRTNVNSNSHLMETFYSLTFAEI